MKNLSPEKSQRVDDYIKANYGKQTAEQMADALGVGSSTIRRRMRKMSPNSQIQDDLEGAGLDKDNWQHAWLKSEGTSIFIRNKEGFVTYTEVRDELVAEMKKYAPKYPEIKRTKREGYLLVVDPADIHFGKLARKGESDLDYDLDVAERRFNEGIDSLISKVGGFGISEIVLVLGNDILHIDNPKRTTTSGTSQDTSGMWWEAFNLAKKCYIRAIEKLVQIGNVHLVFCPSNHDFMSGFMLADSVSSWFHNSKNVTSNATMHHRKYIHFGSNLLGFTHGDGAKRKDLPALMAKEAKGEWATSAFCYWYVHHVHHKDRVKMDTGNKKFDQIEKDEIGVTTINTGLHVNPDKSIQVEAVRTPSVADRWHYTNGYTNIQAMECFLHSPYGGQEVRITHLF